MDSNTDIFVYFEPAGGYDGVINFTVDGAGVSAVKTGNRYLVKVTGISAHRLGVTHTVIAATESGESKAVVSAMSYVYGLLTADAYKDNAVVQKAAAALYGYYAAAAAYYN